MASRKANQRLHQHRGEDGENLRMGGEDVFRSLDFPI